MAHVKSSTKTSEKSLQASAPVEQAAMPMASSEKQNEQPEKKDDMSVETVREESEAQTVVMPALPDHVDRMLRVFSNHEVLYVNSKGGAFSVDTPASVRGDAVLYQNPYFNS